MYHAVLIGLILNTGGDSPHITVPFEAIEDAIDNKFGLQTNMVKDEDGHYYIDMKLIEEKKKEEE